MRTQLRALQECQGAPSISRSRDRRQQRNATHQAQMTDTVRASAFKRLGPLCRLDANGRIHLESKRAASRNEQSADGRTRRALLLETSTMVLSAQTKGSKEGRPAVGTTRRTDRRGNVAESSHHPSRSPNRRDDRHEARSGDRRNEDHGKSVRTQSQHRSMMHSAAPSRVYKEDSQGLLPEERCEVSNGGGALTVINTRTDERTTYRVA